jgi:protein SCO1/2
MNSYQPGKGKYLARCAVAICALALLAGFSARAENQNVKPSLLLKVGIDQKLNAELPLDLTFRDESGKTVRLGEYFDGKPVILALVYYECPMLCTQELNGLLRSLQNISLDIGKQFNVVTVSFNPKETPGLAANKKKVYVGIYGRPGAAEGWHFLTGDEDQIQRLTNAVGYHYAFDPVADQYAHATAIMVVTPQGKLSRYFYGIDYPSRDLRLSLVEASNNKIGSPVDEVLLYCYHYDPATGKYGLIVSNVLRLAGSITIVLLGGLIWILFRQERKPTSEGARAGRDAVRPSR